MITSMVSRGHSFKGIAAYLTATREGESRALWTGTQNVGTNDVPMAARIMAATAMDADRLKAEAGSKVGNKAKNGPVYHALISWDESRHPDAQHQEETARALLVKLGLDKAQAVMVGHNDNGKTHLHIVVNLVDPDTGKRFVPSNDFVKMEQFRLVYARENGIDLDKLMPNQSRNKRLREEAKAEKQRRAQQPEQEAPSPIEDYRRGRRRLSRDEWNAMKAELFERQKVEREAVKVEQGGDWAAAKQVLADRREQEKARFKAAYDDAREQLKAEMKPHWDQFYARQKAERDAVKVQQKNDWHEAKRVIADRKARNKDRFSAALAHARAELKEERKPEWRDLLKRQDEEKRRAAKQIEEARKAVARAKPGIFARVKTMLGYAPSPTLALRAQQKLTNAERAAEETKARHEAERKQRAAEISAIAFERAKAATPLERLDLSDMKQAHADQWAKLHERQQAERKAEWLEKGSTIRAEAFERAKAATPRQPLDLSAMKAAHGQQWEQLRDRHNREREAAGLRTGQWQKDRQAREQDHGRTEEQRERQEYERRATHSEQTHTRADHERAESDFAKREREAKGLNKWGGTVSEAHRKQLAKQREREQQERQNQKGRTRDLD